MKDKEGFIFRKLIFDIWLLDALLKASDPDYQGNESDMHSRRKGGITRGLGMGITLEELQNRWSEHPHSFGVLSRTHFNRHRAYLNTLFGVKIECFDNRHYVITNPECLQLRTLANDLLASMQEFLFLDQFRELGDAIQPERILTGMEYLHPIGDALRHHNKLRITYQKFTDSEPYEAILQPYCLKADHGRWYILAHKEGSEHEVQTFALDRTKSLHVMTVTFKPKKNIDPATYFRDCYGIWRDYDKYPVQDVIIACAPWVAPYLRTLPLHHSQTELTGEDREKAIDAYQPQLEAFAQRLSTENNQELCITNCALFSFHISPSPDFIAELKKWGEEVHIIYKEA